jgi:hypothetical protein
MRAFIKNIKKKKAKKKKALISRPLSYSALPPLQLRE